MVDESNAFNNLNRQLALANIASLCPAFSRVLINTYRNDAKLFVGGGETILSREGTTQGDPLAMAMYALALVPMITRLSNVVKQVWYADDVAAAGHLADLRTWWDMLCDIGPQFGYFVNSSKTFLIVKGIHLPLARSIFGDTGVQFTTERNITAQLMAEVCPNVSTKPLFNQLLMNVFFTALQIVKVVLALM